MTYLLHGTIKTIKYYKIFWKNTFDSNPQRLNIQMGICKPILVIIKSEFIFSKIHCSWFCLPYTTRLLHDSRKEAHRKKAHKKKAHKKKKHKKKAHKKEVHKKKHKEKCPQGNMPTWKNAHKEKCPQGKMPTGKNAHREKYPQGKIPTGENAYKEKCSQCHRHECFRK